MNVINLLKKPYRFIRKIFWRKLGIYKCPCLIHIFESEKLIYVEVPKAGCTSVKHALKDLKGINDKYMKDGEVEKKFHRKFGYCHIAKKDLDGTLTKHYKDYKKFTVVRNPYDRFLSLYKDVQSKNTDKEGYKGDLDGYIEQFLCSAWRDDPHGCPQTHLIGGDLSIYDHVGRTENLKETFDYLSDILNKKIEYIHKNKKTVSERTELSEKNKKFISKLYKKDFEILNYPI